MSLLRRRPLKLFSLLLVGALLRSIAAWATPTAFEEGLELRAFIRETIAASGEADSVTRAKRMRETFARHPAPLAWIIENRDIDELLTSADLKSTISVLGDRLPAQVNEGTTSDQFLTEAFYSLYQRLGGKPGNPQHVMQAAQALRSTPPFKSLLGSGSPLLAMPEAARLKALEAIPDPAFEALSGALSSSIRAALLSRSDLVRLLEDPKKGFDFNSIPAQLRSRFTWVLGQYFDRMAEPDKRRIMVALLELPPGATPQQNLSVAIQNSGPGLQKLFQLLGREARTPELQKMMKELLGNVKPLPPEEIESLVKKITGKPIAETFSEFDLKPLGSGTIGQAHRARLKATGEEVVVKLRRPGILEQAAREMDNFDDIATGDAPMQELMQRVRQSVFAEMDFRDEARNTRRGARVYHSEELGLRSVKLARGVKPTEDMLVLKLIKGVPLSKLGKRDLISHGQALQNLLDRWFDEAMFKSGFFHGDLHPDNVFYLRQPKAEPKFIATTLDFGSVDELTLDQRRGFARLMIGTLESDPERIADALEKIVTFPEGSRARFIENLKRKEIASLPLRDRVNVELSSALEAGIKIPASLLKFNRGQTFLEQQLNDVNQLLDVRDPARKLPRFGVQETLAKVSVREGFRELASQAISEEARKTAVITPQLLYESLVAATRQAARIVEQSCARLYKRINEGPFDTPDFRRPLFEDTQ